MRNVIAVIFAVAGCAGPADKPDNYFKYASPSYSRKCDGPYGSVPDGKVLKMYAALVVQGDEKCVSEKRVCKDGVLSGSYIFPGCTVAKAGR